MSGSEMGIVAILVLLLFGGSLVGKNKKKTGPKPVQKDEQADFQKDNIVGKN